MNKLTIRLIKWQFSQRREQVYMALEKSFSSIGTKKQELVSDTFRRWADRDAKRGKLIAHAYRSIQRRLESGRTLSEAMAPFIPSEEMLTIQAGEKGVRHAKAGESGDATKPKIAVALESARLQKVAGDEMRKAVRGQMFEPMTNFVVFLITCVVFGRYVWPDLMANITEHYWPSWSLPIIRIQLWIGSNGLFFVGLSALIWLYYWSLPNWTGRTRQFVEQFPPYNVYRDRVSSAMLGVLGGLIHGGLTFEEALRSIESRSTPYLKAHVRRMIRLVPASGKDQMKALATGLISQEILDQIEDAASSREFDETLAYLGKEALKTLVDTVRARAVVASALLYGLVGVLFMYQTAVQVFGIQDAANKLTKEAKEGSVMSRAK